MLPENTLCYMQLQHQGNSQDITSIFFTRIRSTEGSSARLFFIHFVAPCACSSSSDLKILLQIFLYERFAFRHVVYIHLSVVFPSRMPAGPHFVTQPMLLVTFLIFDINHQQNTRRSDQIETIKTIEIQTTRPRITWKRFYQWLRLPFLKKYSIKCEKV